MARWREIHWALTEVTAPAVEPVSVTEAKARLRISDTADDADLQTLIIAARRQVEHDSGYTLVPTVYRLTFDRFPEDRAIPIPKLNVQSVASVKSYDEDDVEATMSTDDWDVDTNSKPGRVMLTTDASWPSDLREFNAGAIQFTSGFAGSAKTVSSITRSSTTATVTTSAAHGFSTGQRVAIAGANQAAYNGTFEITVTSVTEFTFTVSGSPTSPATGSMTATALGIPENLFLAVLLLVGCWYRTRDVYDTSGERPIPMGYDALLSERHYALA